MNPYLSSLAAALQVLFTTTAEALGRTTGFLQRRRRLTADGLAQALVFRWMAKPNAPLESLARALGVSPQALQQRLGPRAEAFFRALLVEALRKALKARPARLGLLDRFTAVVVEDTTVIALPAALADAFPGCGTGTAALKVLLRWDLRGGELLALSVHPGRTSDRALAAGGADLPEGALHLADQGFFNARRWEAFPPGRFWISRVPAGTRVYWRGAWQSLGELLGGVQENGFDGPVLLAERAGLPCRLTARRCPVEVAARRRRKLRAYTRDKKGREPGTEALALCDWLVFAANVPAERLGAAEVWVAYRCRWQVELLFKRAKQLAGWGQVRGRTGPRVVVELYAKLLGLVVLHWGALLGGAPLSGVSPWKRMCEVQEFAATLRDALARGQQAVRCALERLAQQLARIRPERPCRKRPGTRQLLLDPQLAA